MSTDTLEAYPTGYELMANDTLERYAVLRRLVVCSAVATTLLLLVFPGDLQEAYAGTQAAAMRRLFQESFKLAISTALAAVPVGVTLAWLASRTNLPWRNVLLASWLMGTTLPLYMHAAAWEAGFGQLGWYHLARSSTATPWLSGWRGAWWVHVMAAIPWTVLFTFGHLRSTSHELEELALVDASPFQVLWHVTMVQIFPAGIFCALWIVVWVAGEMTVTDLFQVRTFAEVVYTGFALDAPGGQQAVTPSVVAGICFTLVLTLLAVAACLYLAPGIELVEEPKRVIRFDLKNWRWPTVLLVGIPFFTLMTVIPLGSLVYKAGVELQSPADTPTRVWSFGKAISMTARSLWDFRAEIGWSLAICQLASLSAALLSAWMYAISRRAVLIRVALVVVAAFSLALPGPLLGVGIVRLFTSLPGNFWEYVYSHTIAAPWLAMTVKCFPLSLGLTWIAMALLPPNLADAARNAGATSWQCLIYVQIPVRFTATVVVFLAGVAYCLGDLAASILVVPPGVMTVAISIFGMIHSGVEDRLAALCLAFTGLLSILGLVIWQGSHLLVRGVRGPDDPASPILDETCN